MKRSKLYFDVRDKDYFDNLKEFILTEYGLYFDVVHDCGDMQGVCIISDYMNRRNRKGVFLIKEEKGDISKYCGASEICSALMEANGLVNTPKIYRGRPDVMIICVTSAAGGAGKSTIAQAMGCEFAAQGKQVLYINPDPFSVFDHIFTGTEYNAYTRLRYYINERDDDITKRMKSLSLRNAERRVDFIVNKTPSPDGFMNTADAKWLCAELIKGCPYDVIVFDIPSYPGSGHIELMKSAAGNFIVRCPGDKDKFTASQKFFEKQGIDNISLVMNRADEGELAVPESANIFESHPDGFWTAVSVLCKKAGDDHAYSN